MTEIPSSDAARAIYEELLDAARTRVQAAPSTVSAARGPFSVHSVAGTLGLAAVDLIVLQQEAARAHSCTCSQLRQRRRARSATARAAGRRRALDPALPRPGARARDRESRTRHPTREELDRLITEQIDLDDLSDPTEHCLLVEAVEQVSRITSEAISHGVTSFGPIVIHDPRPRRDRDH
jgi:hypothetical protein